MTLRCIYCGETLEKLLKELRGDLEAIAFLDWHEQHCGEKAVGAIVELKEKKEQ